MVVKARYDPARSTSTLHPNPVALNIFLMIRSIITSRSVVRDTCYDRQSFCRSVILHVYDYFLIFVS
jgi:hypothetical protein